MDAQDKPNDVPGSSTRNSTMDESRSSTATTMTTGSSISPSVDHNATSAADAGDDDHKLAPFNPSCDTSIALALEILNLQDGDVLFDLGCGDGRILIRAVHSRQDCRCVGIEIDDVFATRAQEAIRQQLSLEEQRRIEIRRQDLLETQGAAAAATAAAPPPSSVENVLVNNNNNAHDEHHDFVGTDCRDLSLLEDATALYLYLLPRGLKKLRPLLEKVVARRKEQAKPFRVAAYTFQVVGWDPVIVNRSTKSGVPIYLYQFDP